MLCRGLLRLLEGLCDVEARLVSYVFQNIYKAA